MYLRNRTKFVLGVCWAKYGAPNSELFDFSKNHNGTRRFTFF